VSSPRKLLAYEEVADCSVRLFVGQVMGGFNPHQPPPEYATVSITFWHTLYTPVIILIIVIYFAQIKYFKVVQ